LKYPKEISNRICVAAFARLAARAGAIIVSAALLLTVSTHAAVIELNIPADDFSWVLEFVLAFIFVGLVLLGGINRHHRRKLGFKRASGVARLWS
jgi:hypothetical protein